MDTSWSVVTALTFGMPILLMLWPPQSVRGWSVFLRPVIATVCSESLIYFFLFCVVYPVAAAYGRAHPTVFQCFPILCLEPSCTWIATGGISLAVFAVRQFASYVTGTDEATWPWNPRV